MMNKQFFHICADGEDARHFITGRKDFLAAMNIVALCAANTQVCIVAFSFEDTHPHFLVYGTIEECSRFKALFEDLYQRYAAKTRKDGPKLVLHCEQYPIGDDAGYLRNVAVYTIIQPTKDGKRVMPYDYLWGTGSLYFRTGYYTPVWLFDEQGNLCRSVRFGDLTVQVRREMVHSRSMTLPDDWLVCNGIALPTNYVDVARFESIYQTHNCFRVFFSNNRKKEEEILLRMAKVRGILLEDSEARDVCGTECKILFGTRDPRKLSPEQRIRLAQTLRSKYQMTIRQIATCVRLPESEIRIFVP
jgi:hypothetical protein